MFAKYVSITVASVTTGPYPSRQKGSLHTRAWSSHAHDTWKDSGRNANMDCCLRETLERSTSAGEFFDALQDARSRVKRAEVERRELVHSHASSTVIQCSKEWTAVPGGPHTDLLLELGRVRAFEITLNSLQNAR